MVNYHQQKDYVKEERNFLIEQTRLSAIHPLSHMKISPNVLSILSMGEKKSIKDSQTAADSQQKLQDVGHNSVANFGKKEQNKEGMGQATRARTELGIYGFNDYNQKQLNHQLAENNKDCQVS